MALGAAGAALVASFVFRRSSSSGLILAAAICLLGHARLVQSVQPVPAHRAGDTLRVRGWVDDFPKTGREGVRFLLAPEVRFSMSPGPDDSASPRGGPGSKLLVTIPVLKGDVGSVGRPPDTAAAAGLLQALLPGRLVMIEGVFLGPATSRNPGDPDWAAWYTLNGIEGRLRAAGPSSIRVADEYRFPDRYVSPVRERLGNLLERFAPGQPGLLLRGLILGERSRIPEERQADYVTVGVMHMLAISGQQVVLVASILMLLVSLFPRWLQFATVSASLGYYVLLTGSTASVTRAAIMAVLVLASRNLERTPDIVNSLGAAAMVILLFDPAQLFDPGFVLSFGAVIAIVTLYEPIEDLLAGRLDRMPGMPGLRGMLQTSWKAAALTLAAGIGTAPVMAYYFGKVSLIGFLANCLIVPLSSLALLLGVALLVAAPFSAWLAGIYGSAAGAVCDSIFALVEWFADFPAAMVEFRLGAVGLGLVCLLMALLLRRNRWKYAIVVALAALNFMTIRAIVAPGSRLNLTFVDVGQGDAAILRSPDGRALLMDTGLAGRTGRPGQVAGVAREYGIADFDAVIISHPHADHMGGAEPILREFSVRGVFGSGADPESRFFRAAMALIDSLRIPHGNARAGDVLMSGPVRAYVLHPPRRTSGHADLSDLNNSSVVLKVVYGSTSAIFTGDIEEEAEEELSRHYGDFLKADILKVAHHGSRTSSIGGFLERVRPRWAVISVGALNRYGHPSDEVISRLSSLGAEVIRTDSAGAIVLESDGSAFSIKQWRR